MWECDICHTEGKLGFTITPCWQLEMHLDSKLIIPVLQAQKKHLALRTKVQPNQNCDPDFKNAGLQTQHGSNT
jgi:hypothetical protein